MKQVRLFWFIAVIGAAIAVLVAVRRRGVTTPHPESRAFEAIQEAAQEAKAVHEREMESKREALGTPASFADHSGDRPADHP